MYTPRAFALDDLPELQQLMHHTRLAQLVTFGEQGLVASHLPFMWVNRSSWARTAGSTYSTAMPDASLLLATFALAGATLLVLSAAPAKPAIRLRVNALNR